MAAMLSMQVHELEGRSLKLTNEVEKPISFRCATFGASSLQDRHLATGNFTGSQEPNTPSSLSNICILSVKLTLFAQQHLPT